MRISDWSSDVCSSDLRLIVACFGQNLDGAAFDGDVARDREPIAGARGINLHLVDGALFEAGEGCDAERADRIAGRSRRVVAADEAPQRAGAPEPGTPRTGSTRAATDTNDAHPPLSAHPAARKDGAA